MFSIDGLVSGLDTTSIIEGLVSLQEAQVDRLNVRKNEIVTQQTAFQGIEARLLSLRSSMGRLNRSTSSVFEQNQVTSSDEDALTAKASSSAAAGSYSMRVISLAKAHQLGSAGFDSSLSSISQGTIEFKVGDRPPTQITIDDSNNTIDGLVNAINTQSDDVSASIIHDQANNADRILLTSKHTGEANEIVVTNNLAPGSASVIRPDFSGIAIQEAQNATIQLGSGAGAITAEYESNTVDGLIEGVTLNLAKADVDKEITIDVARNTETARETIEAFVEEYNSLISFIDEQTQFNAETNEASPLLGNRNVSTLKNKLGALVTEIVPGLDPSLNRFSQLGISIDGKGKLAIDSAKLDDVLNGEVEGVDAGDIKRLFGLGGESNNANVEFILGSTRTQASDGAYEVDILQAAERATVTATQTLASTVQITSANRDFQVSIDGKESETLSLSEGTYTREELAQQVESLINASSSLTGRSVSVSLDGNALKVTSDSYGKSSEIASFTGTAAATLGFDGTELDQGVDVAGSFIVNGVVETATGSGRVLVGDSDNENTADLQIRVTLDSSQVGTGVEAEIAISRGITSRLDQYFGDTLDPDVGSIKIANEDFELRIESLEASIERVNAISESKTEYLIEQFTALERVLSDLQGTSSFLTSQLASI